MVEVQISVCVRTNTHTDTQTHQHTELVFDMGLTGTMEELSTAEQAPFVALQQ
jgi:hypothetical protein